MRPRFFCLCAAGLVLLQMGGCASIVTGQNQSISVQAQNQRGEKVAGAQCKLSNNKGQWFVTTPGSTVVHRSFENLAVQCEKESHEPSVTGAVSTTQAMAFGNILIGGIIGAAVDVGTGAAYDYPSMITVTMNRRLDIPVEAQLISPASFTPVNLGPKPDWIAGASSYSRGIGCSAEPVKYLKAPAGPEMYEFSCNARAPLQMECWEVFGGCRRAKLDIQRQLATVPAASK